MQRYSVETTSGPDAEPLELAETKAHLRVDTTADDDLITALITAARQWAEEHTGRDLITRTRKLYLDAFPWVILLPHPPFQSLVAITYVDTEGATQTLSSSVYDVDSTAEPARVAEAWEQEWPHTRREMRAVTVEYKSGYGDAAAKVPQALRQAMLLLIGHWYEHREEVNIGNIVQEVPAAADRLLRMYRVSGYWWRPE